MLSCLGLQNRKGITLSKGSYFTSHFWINLLIGLHSNKRTAWRIVTQKNCITFKPKNCKGSSPLLVQQMEAQYQASMPQSQKELEFVLKALQEEEPGLARESLLRFVLCYCYQFPSKPSHQVDQLWTINSKSLFWTKPRMSPAQTTFPSTQSLFRIKCSAITLLSLFLYSPRVQPLQYFT